MTAVAPPPNLQNINRSAWGSSNSASNGLPAMSSDDVSRMLMPSRKTATRSNSSSSLSSVASNSSTVTTASTGSTPSSTQSANGEAGSRKRRSGYLWNLNKSEPTAGLSTARPQSMTSTAGPSAASAISAALQGPVQMMNSSQPQQNGVRQAIGEGAPVLCLQPINGTFERKMIQVPYYPDVIKIGRQTNAKTLPTQYNGYFDSKVLSRSHAELWADRNGKIWIRDIKSSNGTFVNGHRLSQENKDSDPHELRDNDMLELGIDIVSEDQKTVVHHKVSARVENAGFMSSNALLDLNLVDMDPTNPQAQMINQAMGHIRRKSGQNDMSLGGRQLGLPVGVPNQPPPQRPHSFLMNINLESVVKKLTAEYKLAQQQSQELQRSTQFLDSILQASQSPKESTAAPTGISSDLKRGSAALRDLPLKPRFCDPPNPPPQAPLPEKPIDISGSAASLKRAETEKPKLPNGPSSGSMRLEGSAATQIQTLNDALTAAKEEFQSQNQRLRDMENLLVEERVKREDAEARAKQLEQINSKPPKKSDGEGPTTPIEDEASSEIGPRSSVQTATEKLQKRLEALLVEFQEIKAEADKWKREKEEAEKERDSERKEKLGLMEMVEKLRNEEKERLKKKDRKRESRKASEASAGHDNDPTDAVEVAERETEDGLKTPESGVETIRSKPTTFSNGHLSQLLHSAAPDGGTATRHAHGQLVQAAPYLSAMSVVLIGVAVMALVNNMSRGER